MTQIIIFSKCFFFLYSNTDQQKLKQLSSLTMFELTRGINSVILSQFLSGIKKFLTRIQLLKIQFTEMFYDHKP